MACRLDGRRQCGNRLDPPCRRSCPGDAATTSTLGAERVGGDVGEHDGLASGHDAESAQVERAGRGAAVAVGPAGQVDRCRAHVGQLDELGLGRRSFYGLTVLLFESWLRHEVPPNPVRAERVSISFNFNWF